MSEKFNRKTVLEVVANEKLGFSFGKLERPDDKGLAVILPILRNLPEQRNYILVLPSYREAKQHF